MIGRNQCKHGSLARSCNTCELEAEIERLKAELAEFKEHGGYCRCHEAIEDLATKSNLWKSKAEKLAEALRMLYEETADYIKINHLGPIHHNQSMKLSKEALAQFEEGK